MAEDTKDYNAIAQSCLDAPFYAQQKRTELRDLLRILDTMNVKSVLEIGVFKGGTIKAWAEVVSHDAHIIGVDLPSGSYGGGFNNAEAENIKGLAKYNQRIDLLAMDSHDSKTAKMVSSYAPFDFIFIDGDHTLEGVTKDFELYMPMLSEHGIMAFHDIVRHTNYPEVKIWQFWNKIKKDYVTTIEMIDLNYNTTQGLWGGIGVIML